MTKDKYKNIDNLIKNAYFTSGKAYKVLSRHLEDERYDSDRDELLKNLSENHSHQWTDFGYGNFKDVIKTVYGI